MAMRHVILLGSIRNRAWQRLC